MLRFILLAAVFAGSVVAPAAAEAPALADPLPLTDAELDGGRGGFIIPGGQELSFSAVMRSYVDGRLVLESQLSVGDQGRTLTGSAPDAPLPASTLEGLTAAGLNLGSSVDGGNVFVSDDRQTVFVHSATGDQLASLLVNTASDRDLRQETALSLVMPGFEATQAAMRDTLAARALASDLRTALVGR